MAIVINGSGTVTGLAVGGLPDGTVDAGTLATDSVVTGKIADGTIANADIADLAASKLTGALPAISGASLTGLTSAQMPTGSIVQVQTTRGDFSADVSTTSTSFVEVHSSLRNTFTPKFADSTLMIEYTTCSSGYSAAYITHEIRADGSRLDTNSSDVWTYITSAGTSIPVSLYLEVPSWGTSSKVISPYFNTNGAAVYANWAGSPAYCFVKITEVAA